MYIKYKYVVCSTNNYNQLVTENYNEFNNTLQYAWINFIQLDLNQVIVRL